MKRNFILFVIAPFSIFSLSKAMEETPTFRDACNKMAVAFTDFGLNYDNYSFNIDQKAETPEEYVPRWKVISTHIELTKDIQSNPDLAEFAANCCAAYAKCKGPEKLLAAYLTSGALILGVPSATILLAQNSPYYCLLSCASLVTALLAVATFDLPTKVANLVDNHPTKQAFSMACKKLIEQKRLQPLAMYYAFAQFIKHAPVEPQSQYAMIIQSLNEKNYSIQANIRTNSVETYIFDTSKKPAAQVACAFYPPQPQKQS